MRQAIVIFLKKNLKIESIRREYEQNKLKPHVTLAFPFDNIHQPKIYDHIKQSLKGIKPFNLELKRIRKSPKEYYLYLLVNRGKDRIIKIHNRFYSKLLTEFLRKDMPYIPHLTLGVFKRKEDIEDAIIGLQKQKLHQICKISSVHLITLNKDNSIKSKKRFSL